MKRCKQIEADGFHHCGSYAFNLEKDGIEQGDLCDVHYWQDQAMKAAAQPEQPEQEPVQFKCTVIDDAHPSGIPLEQWAKPQRTWVGLTPKELNTIFDGFKTWSSFQITDVYFAIEAKLRSKNT